jgi:hypothetical protein
MTPDRRLAVTVAVIGVFGALLGAGIGGYVTYLTTRETIEEQRSTEARVKRESAYNELMAASERLRAAVDGLASQCDLALTRGEVTAGVEGLLCSILYGKAADSAESAYIGAANRVFVYGSNEAYTWERKLAATILNRRSLGRAAVVDETAYDQAREAFQFVMCRELSPEPRSGCSEISQVLPENVPTELLP